MAVCRDFLDNDDPAEKKGNSILAHKALGVGRREMREDKKTG